MQPTGTESIRPEAGKDEVRKVKGEKKNDLQEKPVPGTFTLHPSQFTIPLEAAKGRIVKDEG